VTQRLFCFGFGYSAQALAACLDPAHWQVSGTARSAQPGQWLFERRHPLPEAALQGVTHLLISIPPDAEGDPVLDGCGDALLAMAPSLRWIGYLSTTGVYGDHGGDWVDESTPPKPSSPRAQWRVAAEQAWLALADRLPVHIFRLAGIYGPGRSSLDDLKAGTARRILKPGQWFSRIHRDDIAAVLLASMQAPRPGRIYNVCDDEAAPSPDVIAFAARLLGIDPPPLVPFDQVPLSPMAQSFWADNKRVRNDRLHNELGVTLRYPSYREGLSAIAATLDL